VATPIATHARREERALPPLRGRGGGADLLLDLADRIVAERDRRPELAQPSTVLG